MDRGGHEEGLETHLPVPEVELKHGCRSEFTALVLGAACALASPFALGQLVGADLQKRVNGVLALMGYMLTPDVTTGSLGISNAATGNPDFDMTTAGGGFTVSREFPLYLEGTLGYSRYDPTFVASGGQAQGSVAAKWDAYSATGGIGWDFPVAEELALRPIFNFSYGRVDSHVSASGQTGAGAEIDFLENGRLDAYGLGGSLVLDYERYRPENEIDVELRYTNIYLRSFGGSSTAVQGSADSQSVSLWARWRAPMASRCSNGRSATCSSSPTPASSATWTASSDSIT